MVLRASRGQIREQYRITNGKIIASARRHRPGNPLVAKLRKSGWTAGRMPRVFYLADRNILVDQPKDDYFVPAFGDVVHKISRGHAQRSRETYFALYQFLEGAMSRRSSTSTTRATST